MGYRYPANPMGVDVNETFPPKMAEQFELVNDYAIRKPIDTPKETNIETETPNHQFFGSMLVFRVYLD